MPSLRTKEMVERYKKHREENPSPASSCALCDKKPLKTFTHWKIAENDFPYDAIAEKHHMILLQRHAAWGTLSEEEKEELEEIKAMFIDKEYDYIIEATAKTKSIPAHFHLHLIIQKP